MTLKIAVLGAGSWGLTLTQVLHDNRHRVTVWEFDRGQAAKLKAARKFKYLPEVTIPRDVEISPDMGETVAGADLVVVAVPSPFVRDTVSKLAELPLGRKTLILCATKGLEDETFQTMSQVIAEELPAAFKNRIAVLSGPNISKEIALRKPAATVVACHDLAKAQYLQKELMTEYFRIYTSTDVIGTELGGAIKNVIAIACGICDGMKLGTNAKSALITRGVIEMARLGKHFRAKPETFSGLSGLGDLITTCYSPFSRNRRCGEMIAAGDTYQQAMKKICTAVEGIKTCQAIYHFSRKYKINMPINEQVYKILVERRPPRQALMDLMTREAKHENKV